MIGFPGAVERKMLVRSLTVQGSWNYETLIGTGFAFLMLPALRHLYPDDPEGLRAAMVRHGDLFNCHPYLATLAAGAVARLEADRVQPQMVERFKTALRGSLGSVGDQLVWGAWRPAAVLLGLVLILSGVVWWASVLLFLLAYNVIHIGLRVWGLRQGAATGFEVGRMVRAAPLQALGRRAADAGALLAGFAVVLAVGPVAREPGGLLLATALGALGFWLGLRARTFFAAVVGLVWLVAILLGMTGHGA
jgi:mannose PTS system EIID component